jgi:hypothetical protein
VFTFLLRESESNAKFLDYQNFESFRGGKMIFFKIVLQIRLEKGHNFDEMAFNFLLTKYCAKKSTKTFILTFSLRI